MKSFKQFNEAGYTDRFAHTSAEDDNKHLINVQDEKVVQRLNGYVGAIADREYLQPEAAIKQLNNKLGIVGLNFAEPKVNNALNFFPPVLRWYLVISSTKPTLLLSLFLIFSSTRANFSSTELLSSEYELFICFPS